MRTVLSAVLGVIALGVLLIAYGVITPRVPAAGPLRSSDQLSWSEEVSLGRAPQFELRCEAGQRAVIRQVAGAAAARCVDDPWSVDAPRPTRASLAYPTSDERTISYARPAAASRPVSRPSVRAERQGRDWQKTAMVIGGSSATGAGIGALFGGKKGALIGAALGGGVSTLYEVKH